MFNASHTLIQSGRDQMEAAKEPNSASKPMTYGKFTNPLGHEPVKADQIADETDDDFEKADEVDDNMSQLSRELQFMKLQMQ